MAERPCGRGCGPNRLAGRNAPLQGAVATRFFGPIACEFDCRRRCAKRGASGGRQRNLRALDF
eukprot:1773664-Alexandrium_andersonii.AAC.1